MPSSDASGPGRSSLPAQTSQPVNNGAPNISSSTEDRVAEARTPLGEASPVAVEIPTEEQVDSPYSRFEAFDRSIGSTVQAFRTETDNIEGSQFRAARSVLGVGFVERECSQDSGPEGVVRQSLAPLHGSSRGSGGSLAMKFHRLAMSEECGLISSILRRVALGHLSTHKERTVGPG